ncbi:hypothetical protein DYU11_23600 [Fibrisoma montanum]|uniref:Signal transduction histidine kinase internal region domain-containing protein n=1 Tax=Fibrisoma montanum TaxID=2305895 RepID=A0A418M2L8_9BACT|nr:histidine kinase [Fibrisoma montanum]RIV19906.1 hypothetical protein DYU11_23600 [Fibrisoma montanum]
MTVLHSFRLPRTGRRLLLLLFWAAFVVLPVFVSIRPPDPPADLSLYSPAYPVLFNLLTVGLFYLNVYVFIPRILDKRGMRNYLFVVVGCLVLIVGLSFGFQLLRNGLMQIHYRMMLASIIPAVFVLSISTTYKVLNDYHQRQQDQKEQENERLKSELAFLRSQISPHFLFNILNSIVSLARLRPESVEPVTIQLAGLMRYMLYDSDGERVPIEREVSYLEDFINLEKLRLGHKVQVQYQVEGLNPAMGIEPMLLIPFVENAFKHGTGRHIHMAGSPAVVEIRLRMMGAMLWFNVRNKVADSPVPDTTEPVSAGNARQSPSGRLSAVAEAPSGGTLVGSGIGLKNVQRRLKLLYPDHYLETSRAGGWYEVSLLLKLR